MVGSWIRRVRLGSSRSGLHKTMIDVVLRLLLIVALPPLLLGVINRTKAFIGGRKGPPLLQPYFDLWRLFHKGTVLSTTTTWLFLGGPVVGVVTALLAAMLVPLADTSAPISFAGDFLLFAYLLALGRFMLVLSALDTGSSFEGMGAARDVTFACFAEPTMFLCLLAQAQAAGSLQMVDMFAGPLAAKAGVGAPLLLVASAWFLLMLAENCRIPFDDPNTHLELTMLHEVIVLDHSGILLALVQLAASLKLFLYASLVVRLAVPINSGLAWLNWCVFIVCVIVVAGLLGVVESVMARLQLKLVPHVLAAAGVVAAFGLVLLQTMP